MLDVSVLHPTTNWLPYPSDTVWPLTAGQDHPGVDVGENENVEALFVELLDV